MSDSAQVLRYTAFDVDGEGGNPAGVVLDARGLDDARMQEIAAEVGFSETAFLVDEGGAPGRFAIRYFSPLAEVAFCGHATIATAVALAERQGTGTVRLRTPAGEVGVETREAGGRVLATLTSVPPTGRAVEAETWVRTRSIAATWSSRVLDARWGSCPSRPGSVIGRARQPSAVRCSSTSSHAQAPSQWPPIRMRVGLLAFVVTRRCSQACWTTVCHHFGMIFRRAEQ